MRVEIKGRTFLIEFQHAKVQSFYQSKETDTTACLIREDVPRRSDQRAPIVGMATVTRHHKDQPNREAARKKALAGVLPAVVVNIGIPLFSLEAKQTRRVFWEAYLNRKKKICPVGEVDHG